MPLLHLERGSGLAADVEPRDAGPVSRAALHHEPHQIAHQRAGLGPHGFLGRGIVHAVREQEGRLDALAAVYDRCHGLGEDNGGNRDAVAIGDGHGVGRPPNRWKHGFGRCSCLGFELVEEAERFQEALLPLDPGGLGDAGGPCINRVNEDVLDRHGFARGMGVAQQEAAHPKRAGVEAVVAGGDPFVERHGDGEGLEHRAKLINVGDDPVAAGLVLGLAAAVRIEAWQRQRGHHLAIPDIQHQPQRRLRLIALHRLRKLLGHRMLNANVERQLEVGPLFERCGRQLPHELLVDIPLDAAHTLVIDIGDAEDLRGLVAGWIGPLDRGQQGQPRNAQAMHGRRLIWRKPALHPFEAARLVVKLARQGALVQIGKNRGELLRRLVGMRDFPGVGGEPIDTDVGGEQRAVAVDDIRPVFGEAGRRARGGEHRHVPRKLGVIDGTARDGGEAYQEAQAQQHLRPAHAPCRALAPWRSANSLQCRGERAHGRHCDAVAPAGADAFSIKVAMPSLWWL